MSNPQTLGSWLRRFLAQYIVTERNLARNTQKSYRDTFALLLPFVSARIRKAVDRLTVEDLTSRRLLQFLAHIEDGRGCCVQTRNQRLAAVRAFARFVASRDPTHVEWCGNIRAIALKKATPKPVGWLSKVEMKALLKVPDRRTLRGQTEYALLLFLYNSGARVSEATGLVVGDMEFGRHDGGHALVTLHGKGGKLRQCPLWPRTEVVLAELAQDRQASDAVFLNRQRRPYTRFGVYRVVERSAAQVPSLAGRKMTPHMIRHTSACHLLQSGVDLNTIRAWLGHVSLDTTNLYAEINLEMKAKAVALCDASESEPDRPWKENKALMGFLGSL